MTYFPKSKISIKETSGDEFVYISTRNPYSGYYIELSEGKFYAGRDPLNLGEEIIQPEDTPNSFGKSLNFKKHKILNTPTYSFLRDIKPIPAVKNIPADKDYERGYYNRYFAKRINQEFGFIEINSDTFNSIFSRKKEFDYNMYRVGSIKWTLTENVEKTNKLNLQRLERTHKNISTLFPLLNEFYDPKKDPLLKGIEAQKAIEAQKIKDAKRQRAKAQKEARLEEMSKVTQEELNKAIEDLDSGNKPYIYNPGY